MIQLGLSFWSSYLVFLEEPQLIHFSRKILELERDCSSFFNLGESALLNFESRF
ncbi:hypothetical protein Golax_016765 [Gossypium laxum]|uniref:Uncharacterized protein n=1 Tax=Gossypium laxum TaxID=34288 RepID=A0A7J8YY62_9ROSI|nr:hypothetical protein [Gossypium laxum]